MQLILPLYADEPESTKDNALSKEAHGITSNSDKLDELSLDILFKKYIFLTSLLDDMFSKAKETSGAITAESYLLSNISEKERHQMGSEFLYESFKYDRYKHKENPLFRKEFLIKCIRLLTSGIGALKSNEFSKFKTHTLMDYLEKNMERISIIVIGETHDRNHLETDVIISILKLFHGRKRPIRVFLENIDNTQQPLMDKYLNGEIDLAFIRRVFFEEIGRGGISNGLSWKETKILEYAKSNAIPVMAFDNKKLEHNDLEKRDGFMTEKVLRQLRINPEEIQFTLIGNYHNMTQREIYESYKLSKGKVIYMQPIFDSNDKVNLLPLMLNDENERNIFFTVPVTDLNKDKFDFGPMIKQCSMSSSGELFWHWNTSKLP